MTRLVRWSFPIAPNHSACHRVVGICTTQLVVMLLAHARQDSLLFAVFHRAQFLLGTVGNATTTLNGYLVAIISITSSTGRTVGTAHTSLFHILGTSRVATSLSLGTMRNAQSSLDNPVWTIGYGALAADALTGTTRSQPGPVGPFRAIDIALLACVVLHLLLVDSIDRRWIAMTFWCNGLGWR